MKNYKQLSLFEDAEQISSVRVKKGKGGSQNPIVFHDYESYVAKFQHNEKTTDDTYTPPDVYEAVQDYVRSIYPMEGKEILRPFYPGGDYEHAEYPEDGVVIDNPPFSMFTKICKFYSEYNIPFFLFGPGLTIFSCLKYCSVVIVAPVIEFSNGAKVKCNFATNLIGNVLVTTSPELSEAIAACPSQPKKVNMIKYQYPKEVLSVSDMQIIAKNGVQFSVNKNEAVIIRDLDLFPKKSGLFGDHLFISKSAAAKSAAAKLTATRKIPVELSERERRIIEGLGG